MGSSYLKSEIGKFRKDYVASAGLGHSGTRGAGGQRYSRAGQGRTRTQLVGERERKNGSSSAARLRQVTGKGGEPAMVGASGVGTRESGRGGGLPGSIWTRACCVCARANR